MPPESESETSVPSYYSWNSDPHNEYPIVDALPKPKAPQLEKVEINDEGMRDGLQGVEIFPTAEQRKQYVDLAAEVGIDAMTVGIYTGSGNNGEKERMITFDLLRHLRNCYPNITPIILARALESDITWARDCADVNPKLEVIVFQGSSEPRMWVEKWTRESVAKNLGQSITLATKSGLAVMAATEDTTRTDPDFLEEIVQAAVDGGAKRFCIADTVGAVDPWGAYRLTLAVRKMLDVHGGKDIKIDFHGHRDRGMAEENAIAAIAAGAHRIHGVPIGLGERSGNASLELLMVNINKMAQEAGTKKSSWNLKLLNEFARYYSSIVGINIPHNAPLVGKNAYTTQAGIHTAALEKAAEIIEQHQQVDDKALRERVEEVAGTVYTSVRPEDVGRTHEFELSPMSGASTAKRWLATHGLSALVDNQDVINKLLGMAKTSGRTLKDQEIFALLRKGGHI